MLVTAVRHVRKMRGGAQAHLLEADDANWYVVKFRNNPQHGRILVNELLSASLLRYLNIAAPETAVIRITDGFLAANPDVYFSVGPKRIPVEAGWHFGSRYPGDPARIAVYDFLPAAVLPQVVNLEVFRAALVFDKWVGNTDGRQSVFYRALVRREVGQEAQPGFVARMIDQGFSFNGPGWDFGASALHGLYARHSVYDSVRSLDDFQPWLGQVMDFPEEVIDQAWKRVPSDWIAGDEDALERLLERLYERRARAPELIEACRESRTNPFRNWAGRLPRLIPALAVLALLVIAVALPVPRHSVPAPFAVKLLTMRNTASQGTAPSRQPLRLDLDLAGLAASPSYRIEIVNKSDHRVWQGVFNSRGATGSVAIPAQMRGTYFVRVALPSGENLREYRLEIRGKD